MRKTRELRALITGGVDYGEADRVVHLLTAEGRLSAFAHGARKSRRRFAGAIEPFATVQVVLSERTGGQALATLESSAVEAARLPLREDLAKIALASHVVELSALVSPEGGACALVLALAEGALDRLLEIPASAALRRAFELRLVQRLGYAPELSRCVECGAEGALFLDLTRGGRLCAVHAGGAPEIGPRTLQWMGAVLEEGAGLSELGGKDPDWAERAARKLARPLDDFFRGLLPRPLGSARLLQEVSL